MNTLLPLSSWIPCVFSLFCMYWQVGTAQTKADGVIGSTPSPSSQSHAGPPTLISSQSPLQPTPSISSLRDGIESHRQDLLKSVLAQKEFLLRQEGELFPSALPDDLLPRQILKGGRRKTLSTKQINAARKRLWPQTTQASLYKATLESTFFRESASANNTPDSFTLWPHSSGQTTPVPLETKIFSEESDPSESGQSDLSATISALETTPLFEQPRLTPDVDPRLVDSTTIALSSSVSNTEEGSLDSIIRSTILSATQPASCNVNFSEPEGYIDSTDYPPLLQFNFLECTYNVTVYTGYGVELQVKNVNLSEGELLSIRGVEEGGTLLVLANETLLVEGQVIRSPTNTISVFFRTFLDGGLGTFQLHYQIFMLSCSLPRKPHYGEVLVMDLHAGGTAHFHCHSGYQLQGEKTLTCLNASRPHWSSKEPACKAVCGGRVHNASIGRILSPNHPGNYSNNMSCTWFLETSGPQKLHLHFEKLSLAGHGDRIQVWSGLENGSVVLLDSARGGQVPFEGIISEGPVVTVQFTSDSANTSSGFNIRYEAFERGHCYEPYIQNGNFTTTDSSYNVGAIVEFTCEPGHSLEQGPPVIECVNMRDPYWNDTEPLCKALCGGELSAPSGVILSPNWPDSYGEGEDCSWRIHVGEERRILLDIQLLNLSNSDILTIYDGDEITTRILGQYIGGTSPFKLYSSTPDLTLQFHSDPAGMVFGKGEGFIINYMEVSRNDSCSDLPEIQNGWKTTSHMELVRGARVTYQCDPGYDIVGSETLICQWDLVWSSQPPFCEKIMYCTDPGQVEHSSRTLSDPKLLVGTTIQYTCRPGYILEGSSMLTCYGRETGTPVWTSRLPLCVSEESVSCENPGLPENGYQILYKRLYLPGESLSFMCYEGFELIGEITIKCILGHPSFWSGPLPLCRANQDSFERALEVAEAEAAAATSLDGGNMALVIFIPVLVLSVLLGGAYIYITRCRYHSNLRLPLMYTHPYSQITVETEFDNPMYETGDTREYEVSI
ncbi:seizure 6-like protein isoform X3 [Polypterus senegalus]|uniref:seizure 6-like protein isoform X3 n=1 Tax=Polypterus senegalus TaxID=55291 RepID=UPI0019639E6D|nr:seizure 6-like protein isoform X3 [Polypterus senegalus]